MKTSIKVSMMCCLLFLLFTNSFGQNHVVQADIIQKTISKSKTIQSDFRVIEKTFSEYIFKGDSVVVNRFFKHTFSSSNTYHITGISPYDYISNLDIIIYKFDANNKLQRIGADETVDNEVNLTFKPTESGEYFIVVNGTLKGKMESAFFSIIVDRD